MARKSKKRSKKRKSAPSVSVRFANSGGTMAKRRKRRGTKRRTHRKGTVRRANPRKRRTHRRRRNPANTFMDRAARLAGLALVTVGTGVATTFAMTKLAPPAGQAMSPFVEYGVPAGVFLAGAAASKSSPLLGMGLAAGAFAPFVLPVTSKALAATTPATPTTTAAGLGRAFRVMRAVQGRQFGYGMGAVDHPGVGAVNYTHFR
jgi:hypothetical protein